MWSVKYFQVSIYTMSFLLINEDITVATATGRYLILPVKYAIYYSQITTKQIFRQKNVFQRNQFMNNEQAFYTLFVICHSFRQNCFTDSLSLLSKNRLTGKKRRKIDSPKRQITGYTLFVFHLLFAALSVFRYYSRIVYSGL